MKLAPFPVAMTGMTDPFIDPKTGLLGLLTGRKMVEAIWNRTGGGDGIIPSIATGLIATGTSQVTALALTDDWNEVDTIAVGTGVQIPQLSPGQMIVIFNNDPANALKIYPPGGSTIDALAINTAYSLGRPRLQIFWQWSLTQLRSFGRMQIDP
jgi:hypothetical protein